MFWRGQLPNNCNHASHRPSGLFELYGSIWQVWSAAGCKKVCEASWNPRNRDGLVEALLQACPRISRDHEEQHPNSQIQPSRWEPRLHGMIVAIKILTFSHKKSLRVCKRNAKDCQETVCYFSSAKVLRVSHVMLHTFHAHAGQPKQRWESKQLILRVLTELKSVRVVGHVWKGLGQIWILFHAAATAAELILAVVVQATHSGIEPLQVTSSMRKNAKVARWRPRPFCGWIDQSLPPFYYGLLQVQESMLRLTVFAPYGDREVP